MRGFLRTDIKSSAEVGEKAQTGSINNIVKVYNFFAKEGKKVADETEKSHARMAKSTASVDQSAEKLLRTMGALFLLMAGASSLKSFIGSMVNLDATVGRLAHNTGQTTEVISGIGRAAERMAAASMVRSAV